jgi:hypothetical protein
MLGSISQNNFVKALSAAVFFSSFLMSPWTENASHSDDILTKERWKSQMVRDLVNKGCA